MSCGKPFLQNHQITFYNVTVNGGTENAQIFISVLKMKESYRFDLKVSN